MEKNDNGESSPISVSLYVMLAVQKCLFLFLDVNRLGFTLLSVPNKEGCLYVITAL